MGVKKKMTFFRPDVTFGIDARCLLNPLKDGKKIQETNVLGVICRHLGYDTAPSGFLTGAQKWGKVLARAFLRVNSVLRRAKDFRMPKIEINPHSLPIPTLICYLFSKFEE